MRFDAKFLKNTLNRFLNSGNGRLCITRGVGTSFILIENGVILAKIMNTGVNPLHPGSVKIIIESPKRINVVRTELITGELHEQIIPE